MIVAKPKTHFNREYEFCTIFFYLRGFTDRVYWYSFKLFITLLPFIKKRKQFYKHILNGTEIGLQSLQIIKHNIWYSLVTGVTFGLVASSVDLRLFSSYIDNKFYTNEHVLLDEGVHPKSPKRKKNSILLFSKQLHRCNRGFEIAGIMTRDSLVTSKFGLVWS